jgi:hypothetical protein
MTPTSDGTEDQLLALLCPYDEALASGKVLNALSPADAVTDVAMRLQRLQSCLRFLEMVWPRHPASWQNGEDPWNPSPFSLQGCSRPAGPVRGVA